MMKFYFVVRDNKVLKGKIRRKYDQYYFLLSEDNKAFPDMFAKKDLFECEIDAINYLLDDLFKAIERTYINCSPFAINTVEKLNEVKQKNRLTFERLVSAYFVALQRKLEITNQNSGV